MIQKREIENADIVSYAIEIIYQKHSNFFSIRLIKYFVLAPSYIWIRITTRQLILETYVQVKLLKKKKKLLLIPIW